MEKDPKLKKQLSSLLEKTEDFEEFLQNLRRILIDFSDEERKETYKKYIPNMGDNLGTPLPVLNLISNEFGKWGEKNANKALDLLMKMWQRTHEERMIACKSLERIGKADLENSLRFIESILNDIKTWDICDTLATSGMKNIIISKSDDILASCERWVEDENKWIRRFAVVSLIPLVRIAPKKYQFGETELKIIEKLMEDEETDVKKGVAWVLRQISKKNPELIFNFLIKQTKTTNRNTKWIVRNGMKKLSNDQQEKIKFLIAKDKKR